MIGRSRKAIALKVSSFALLAACAVSPTLAQQSSPQGDFAIMYAAERGNSVGNGGNFWLQGGSIAGGLDVWHGLGVAGNFTGSHSSPSGAQNVPLNLLTTTFGPRYRWSVLSRSPGRTKDLSLTGEALFGSVHGSHGFYPGAQGGTYSTSAFAMQVGGAVDLGLTNHIAVRVVQADWVRMELPNATTNVQNDFRISAGIVFRFNR